MSRNKLAHLVGVLLFAIVVGETSNDIAPLTPPGYAARSSIVVLISTAATLPSHLSDADTQTLKHGIVLWLELYTGGILMCHDAVETEVAFVAVEGSGEAEERANGGSVQAPAGNLNRDNDNDAGHEIIITMSLDDSVPFESAKAAAAIFTAAAATGDVAVIVTGAFQFSVLDVAAAPPFMNKVVPLKAAKVNKGKESKKAANSLRQISSVPAHPRITGTGKAHKKGGGGFAAAYQQRQRKDHKSSELDSKAKKCVALSILAAGITLLTVYHNRPKKIPVLPVLSRSPTEKSPLLISFSES